MPTYRYACQACGHELEEFQSMTSKPRKRCPACGKSKLQRLIGAGAGVIFKGSGFYATDYRSTSYSAGEKAAGESGAGKPDANGTCGRDVCKQDGCQGGDGRTSDTPAKDGADGGGAAKKP